MANPRKRRERKQRILEEAQKQNETTQPVETKTEETVVAVEEKPVAPKKAKKKSKKKVKKKAEEKPSFLSSLLGSISNK